VAQQPIVLLAASGLARAVAAAVEAVGTQRIVGVLDDNPEVHGSALAGVSIVGSISDAAKISGVQFVVCAGGGAARISIVRRLTRLGIGDDRFASILHPSAQIPSSCRIGRGSIALGNVVLTADVTVGSHVVLMPQVVLTHDDDVADFATICAGAVLGGNVSVGSAAYVGMSASVRQGVHVGIGSTLGMGSVLLTDLPDGQVWVGVPAAPLSPRIESEVSGGTHQESGRISASGGVERFGVS